MNKKEVQQRVLQNGKPLDLKKFKWDKESLTFSTTEEGLVIDFKGIDNCTFKTGDDCTFKTGSYCTFDTGFGCTFKTGDSCTFDTGSNCTFDTKDWCVVVRRDVYEIIELKKGQKIKLNGFEVKGYSVITPKHIIKINDKEIELSEESYQNLKSQLS